MANDVVKATDPGAQFQEKVIDRLRSDIGAFMPDEMLSKLIEQAIQQEFFAPVKPKDAWDTRVTPSWFVRQVTEQAKSAVEARVDKFIAERPEVVDRAIEKYLTDHSLTIAVADRIAMKVDSVLCSITSALERRS